MKRTLTSYTKPLAVGVAGFAAVVVLSLVVSNQVANASSKLIKTTTFGSVYICRSGGGIKVGVKNVSAFTIKSVSVYRPSTRQGVYPTPLPDGAIAPGKTAWTPYVQAYFPTDSYQLKLKNKTYYGSYSSYTSGKFTINRSMQTSAPKC